KNHSGYLVQGHDLSPEDGTLVVPGDRTTMTYSQYFLIAVQQIHGGLFRIVCQVDRRSVVQKFGVVICRTNAETDLEKCSFRRFRHAGFVHVHEGQSEEGAVVGDVGSPNTDERQTVRDIDFFACDIGFRKAFYDNNFASWNSFPTVAGQITQPMNSLRPTSGIRGERKKLIANIVGDWLPQEKPTVVEAQVLAEYRAYRRRLRQFG